MIVNPKPIWDITEARWIDRTADSRFAVYTAGAAQGTDDAVLDRETGLVCERSPATDRKAFSPAFVYAVSKVSARRRGWRLPTLEELQTLLYPGAKNPSLPPGHPFLNTRTDTFYWSATLAPSGTPGGSTYWGQVSPTGASVRS